MIKIQGHRGFSESYPENTMLSFAKCYEYGADGIETDIQKTSDGEYILMHDATVDRTTNGTGNVSALTWAYISGLDAGAWMNAVFAGRSDCKVPKLSTLLDTYNGLPITLILQLYSTVEQDVKNVIDMVVSRGMQSQVQFSGGMVAINWAKGYRQDIFTMSAEMPTLSTYQAYLDNAIANNHDAVGINAGVPEADLITMVNNIHGAGKQVHASYLSGSYSTLMARHISVGTDMILGNNPQLMINSAVLNIPSKIIKASAFVKIGDDLIRCKKYTVNGGKLIQANDYFKT